MWPPLALISIDTRLGMEYTSVSHICFTSRSWNHMLMIASISFVFCVQSWFLSLFLTMLQRFLIGLRWPRKSFNPIVSHEFLNFLRSMTRRQILLVNSISSRVVLSKLRHQFVLQYVNVLVGIHHSFNWLQSPRSRNVKTPPEHRFVRVLHVLFNGIRTHRFPNRATDELWTLSLHLEMWLVIENSWLTIGLNSFLAREFPWS